MLLSFLYNQHISNLYHIPICQTKNYGKVLKSRKVYTTNVIFISLLQMSPKSSSIESDYLCKQKLNCDLKFFLTKSLRKHQTNAVSILIQTKQRHNENPISQKLVRSSFYNSCWVWNLSRNFRSSKVDRGIFIFWYRNNQDKIKFWYILCVNFATSYAKLLYFGISYFILLKI